MDEIRVREIRLKSHPGLDLLILDSNEFESQLLAQSEIFPDLKERLKEVQSKSRKLEILAVHKLIQLKEEEYNQVFYRLDGSPFLRDSQREISISHSRGLVAVLFSEGNRVGMDLEHKTPRILNLVKKFAGIQEVGNAPIQNIEDYYIILWTMKEAIVKLFRQRTLDFRTAICVESFIPLQEGVTRATVKLVDKTHFCELHYFQMEKYVLSYAIEVA